MQRTPIAEAVFVGCPQYTVHQDTWHTVHQDTWHTVNQRWDFSPEVATKCQQSESGRKCVISCNNVDISSIPRGPKIPPLESGGKPNGVACRGRAIYKTTTFALMYMSLLLYGN